MNIFKKFFCRTYQFAFKCALPILPYREPKLLDSYEKVVEVLNNNNHKSVLLVTDKGIYNLGLTKNLEEVLTKANIKVCVYSDTVANPTTQNVNEALNLYKKENCSALIAFGGGSAMDCAKGVGARLARPNKTLGQMKGVLKVRKKIPLLLAIPTTAGTGSETTLAAVITDSETRHKYAINDFPLIPSYALLMPELTVGLPKSITATTGMDALTHAVEAYIGRSTTPKTRKCAKYAVKTIFENIKKAYDDGSNLEAREKMLKSAYYAGVAFTKSYVGYIHAIAHSLGGKYNIPHGLANAIIMPYVLKSYGKKVYKKLYELGIYANLFDESVTKEQGAKLFIKEIEKLNEYMNIPNNIPEIKTEDIRELAKTAEREGNPLYPVPVIYSAEKLEELYYQIKDGVKSL